MHSLTDSAGTPALPMQHRVGACAMSGSVENAPGAPGILLYVVRGQDGNESSERSRLFRAKSIYIALRRQAATCPASKRAFVVGL